MKIKVSRRDVIWSYISTLMSMLANFLILPFVLRYLDDPSIGLYYVFTSLSGISALFDFGFAASFSRNIAYCWSGTRELKREGADSAEGNTGVDYVLMKKVLFTSRIIYALLASLALFMGLTAGTIYIVHISKDFIGSAHIIAWIIYAVAIFMNLYYGYFSSYLRGVGAIQAVSKITTISRILQIVIAATTLISGVGLIGVSVAYFLYGLVFRFACKNAFFKHENIGNNLKAIKEKQTLKSIGPVFKTIWYNAWREGVVSLSNYLLNQAGTVICSMYYSLTETGIYSLSVQLATAVATISSTMYTTYQPSLQSAYVQRDIEGQKKSMSMIVVTYVGLFILGMMAVLIIGRPFISWLRPSYTISIPMLLAVGLYQFILKFRNCYTTYFSSTNRLIYMKSFVFSAGVCIVLSILLAEITSIGIWGLIISQIFSQAMFNMWYWTFKAHKELRLYPIKMLKFAVDGYTTMLKRKR